MDNKKIADELADELLRLSKTLTADKSELAYKMLKNIDKPIADFERKFDLFKGDARDLKRQLDGLDKFGSGKIEAIGLLKQLRPSIQRLESYLKSMGMSIDKMD